MVNNLPLFCYCLIGLFYPYLVFSLREKHPVFHHWVALTGHVANGFYKVEKSCPLFVHIHTRVHMCHSNIDIDVELLSNAVSASVDMAK